jgi:hypothetical protein
MDCKYRCPPEMPVHQNAMILECDTLSLSHWEGAFLFKFSPVVVALSHINWKGQWIDKLDWWNVGIYQWILAIQLVEFEKLPNLLTDFRSPCCPFSH